MHLVHHSDIHQEHNSNFGFSLSIWDRLFKTYVPVSSLGKEQMRIGVEEYKDQKYTKNFLALLKLPFKQSL